VLAIKPQPGNPYGLALWQHVFPSKSIERFAGSDGSVAVRRRRTKRQFRLAPEDRFFCAQRAWDQRAEAGYMRRIEDAFQNVADQIIGGLRTLDCEQSRIVTKFFALWYLRFEQRHRPTPDHFINGITPEHLSRDQEEMLESNWITFVGAGQAIPGRCVAGSQIQINIDQIDAQFKGRRWGVLTASDGEFFVPDTFARMTIVPVTPTICLVWTRQDEIISRKEVSEFNSIARHSAWDYYFARDFTLCP